MTIDTSREAVEALMKGVTPGPWDFDCLEVIGPRRETVADPVTNKDGRFIAASRQLVPALLDRAEKAEAELAAAERRAAAWVQHAQEVRSQLAALKAERDALRGVTPIPPVADAIMALLTSGARFTGADGREMVVVPVEPSEAMKLAAGAALSEFYNGAGRTADAESYASDDDCIPAILRAAMIAAASEPDAPSGTPL